MKPEQKPCHVCGVVYSPAAFAAHRPDGGRCARPESLGLVHAPGQVWVLPAEVVARVCCPRCGVTFSERAHQAHRPGDATACAAPGQLGLVHDDTLGAWCYPGE